MEQPGWDTSSFKVLSVFFPLLAFELSSNKNQSGLILARCTCSQWSQQAGVFWGVWPAQKEFSWS